MILIIALIVFIFKTIDLTDGVVLKLHLREI
jgi:hypothetical protein